MIKYSLILLSIYAIYYLGNIVYDLFLKKDKITMTEEKEEYSLEGIVSNVAQQVNIDDVEEMIIPSSFQKFIVSQEAGNYRPDIDELRRQFESEEEIFTDASKDFKSEAVPKSENKNQDHEKNTLKNDWKTIMKLSETTVQMVSNYDGQKVYHSIL